MYAIPIDDLDALVFMKFRPPAGLDEYHGPVLADVELILPPGGLDDLYRWAEGAPRPEVVLCRSRSEPRRYAVFKYRHEMDPLEYEETGRNFAYAARRADVENLIGAVVRGRYEGQWVVWTKGGRRFAAAGPTPESVHEAADRAGIESPVYEWIQPSPRPFTGAGT